MKAYLAVLVLALSLTAAAKAQNGVTGTFSLVTAAPTAGQTVTFYVLTSPINDCCGGDTKSAFVDISCPSQNFQTNAPAAQLIPPDQIGRYASALLDNITWSTAGHPAADCTAYLFVDGYHNTRRRSTNTIAGPLFFVAAAQ